MARSAPLSLTDVLPLEARFCSESEGLIRLVLSTRT
jgi:hypothetical protein